MLCPLKALEIGCDLNKANLIPFQVLYFLPITYNTCTKVSASNFNFIFDIMFSVVIKNRGTVYSRQLYEKNRFYDAPQRQTK